MKKVIFDTNYLISETTNKRQSIKLQIHKQSSKFKSYNSQIPSSKLNNSKYS